MCNQISSELAHFAYSLALTRTLAYTHADDACDIALISFGSVSHNPGYTHIYRIAHLPWKYTHSLTTNTILYHQPNQAKEPRW
ncbi:hypothetical protein B0T17DRAFT_269570 [Bombardia bombarda]|uniref:Uncharacterized protein n=1 Tax=Bombardia bombarda TaxID=252184 RepID=A0AA39X118_9PEZI|nr:hypothetical protein B0T17DRAFT_269570 [Bombardia bombarda]